MSAAALRAIALASMTRSTGRPSSLAISAVLPRSLLPSLPSKRPMTPSITATSALAVASATDMIAELDLLDSLVGISEDSNWPPEVLTKPMVARTKIDVSGLTAAEIDALVNESASESHSLYAVDAELMDELRPDLVITQDLCEVCAVSTGDLATACPIST